MKKCIKYAKYLSIYIVQYIFIKVLFVIYILKNINFHKNPHSNYIILNFFREYLFCLLQICLFVYFNLRF